MAMTQEEIRDFWKLGASLQKVPEESDNPQVLNARMSYEYLKDKMLAEITSQSESTEEAKAKLDAKTAISQMDAVMVMLATIASKMIPQLGEDPNLKEMLSNAKLASEWLHERFDSLKNPES